MSTNGTSGLEGVVVADTRLSEVDGERGRLIVAGHDVERLAAILRFEELATLLLGRDVSPATLGAARVDAFARLSALGDALSAPDGMDALRAAVAHLRSEDPLHIAAAVAVFAAAWARTRRNLPPIAPDPSRRHADDYLRMITGAPADDARIGALDAYLVTVADHGMNASTFAARVVASTGSDDVSAIVAAIGALKGPLHGGAPGPVLDMLDAVGTPDHAAAWIHGELDAGRRIMGMGHRIYRVRDPRAAVLESVFERLEQAGVARGRLALARAVEQEATRQLAARHPDRPLRANVEFYTAIVLEAIGLPREAFTPTFAVGRVAGWLAHVGEQRATGRLIRPASRYIGPSPDANLRRTSSV
jgi:citrate synthase